MAKESATKVQKDKIKQAPSCKAINYTVSIIRNFKDIVFPGELPREQSKELNQSLANLLETQRNGKLLDSYPDYLQIMRVLPSGLERSYDALAMEVKEKRAHTAVSLNHGNALEIISSSKKIEVAMESALDIENLFGEFIEFNIHPRLGYVSPDLTRCGLGIQLSVLFHFVGFKGNEAAFTQMKNVMQPRGYKLEAWPRKSPIPYLYTLHSTLNYGVTEEELLERFQKGVIEFLSTEKQLIKSLKQTIEIDEEEVYKSLGVLSFSSSIKLRNAIENLATLIGGVKMGVKTPVTLKKLQQIIDFLLLPMVDEKEDENIMRASKLQTFLEVNND